MSRKRRTPRTLCGVVGCGRPTNSTTICREHVGYLETDLGDMHALAAALTAKHIRSQRFSVESVSLRDPEESNLPYDDKAGRLRIELNRTLVEWFHRVERAHHVYGPEQAVPATVDRVANYLIRHLHWFETNVAGPAAATQFASLHGRALNLVDRPPDLVYLGICSEPLDKHNGTTCNCLCHNGINYACTVPGGCGTTWVSPNVCPGEVYGKWGEPIARCKKCRTQHDVQNRRDILLTSVEDQLAPAVDIARGLSGFGGFDVTADRIRQWKHRGRISDRGPNHHGDPVYRVGDVIDLLVADAEREAERAAKAERAKAERDRKAKAELERKAKKAKEKTAS